MGRHKGRAGNFNYTQKGLKLYAKRKVGLEFSMAQGSLCLGVDLRLGIFWFLFLMGGGD